MNRIIKLLKETIWDFIKDNLKLIMGNIISLLIALVPNYISTVSYLEVKVKVPIIIFFVFVFVMLIVDIFVLLKKCNSLKGENEELKNPKNENVGRFFKGDIVILKIEKDLPDPTKLSVYKVTNSEVICRNNKVNLVNYSPEELLTKTETEKLFQEKEYRRQITEQENEKYWEAINK